MKTTDKTIRKVHRIQDLLISITILAIGVLFTFVVPSVRWLGITALITGAVMLPFYKTGYTIASQKGIFLKKEIILPRECMAQIVDYMEGNSEVLDIDPFNKGGLLLNWYYKKDHSKQFGLLYDFASSETEPQCKLSELNDEKVASLLKYQNNSTV